MLRIQKGLRKIFFRRKKAVFDLYGQLQHNEKLPLEQLYKIQLDKLNRLLTHAYINVPYYHHLLKESTYLKDNKIQLDAIDQLTNLPLLSKVQIKNVKDKIYSSDIGQRKAFTNASGGSTGVPTEVKQDEQYLIAEEAGLLQIKNWRGVGPFDSEIFIWGSPRDTFENKKPLKAWLGDFVRNRIMLNCFKMTPDDIKHYIQLLNHHRPAMVRCYVDAIYEIARYAKKHQLDVVPQKVIHTGAGNLFDYMRFEIEDVFQCPVYNHYGGREVGHIASECSAHTGLHLFMEHNIVELLNEQGEHVPDGVEGELVVTNLNNYAMPLIRYRIGDRGIMMPHGECECGCTYPKLKEITGRVGDVFRTINGQTVSPVFFAHLIGVVAKQREIKRYQAIQHDLTRLTLRIVPEEKDQPLNFEFIIDEIKKVFGNNAEVKIELVDSIEKTVSGKYRYTISEVNN